MRVHHATDSEPAGFRDYVHGRQQTLVRRAYLLTGNWSVAEDLVQETLVRVWPHWSKLLTNAGDPDAYVRRTMINLFISGRRRRWTGEDAVAALPEVPTAHDDFADADLRDVLRRLLPELPPRQRAVVVLRFYDDLTESAVAAALDCSVGTVKSQTAKALTKLRRAIRTSEVEIQ